MRYPKVKIESVSLDENVYVDREGYVYSAIKLIEHSKQYKTFEVPVASFDLGRNAWQIKNMADFIHHAKRCESADLQYPIILDVNGTIADGLHRLIKAIVLGKSTIKVIRLESMPSYDRIEEDENNSK